MKRFVLINLLAIAFLCFGFTGKCQISNFQYPTESLNYEIVYHWGMIWKTAANANLSAYSREGNYYITLTAKTTSFADKFYKVRDTIYSVVDKNGFKPLTYTKITHEGSWNGKDIIKYSYGNNLNTIAHTTLYRRDMEPISNVFKTEAQAYDFLSVFYMLRSLDFKKMPKNKIYVTYVISGKRKEKLCIKMDGKDVIKMRSGKKKEAWKLSFNFTDGSNDKTSDDIFVWISTTDNHVPLLLLGKIKIGEIRCYLKE